MSEWIVEVDELQGEIVKGELIRCRDCKYRQEDGYCSFGERKE